MKPRLHDHPKPGLNRLIHYGALVVTGVMVVSAPPQVVLTLLGAPGGLFVISAVFTVLLALPVLMLTAYAPPITVDDTGLTLHPVVWQDRTVAWEAITAVLDYPLVPSEDAEISRKIAVGKRNYRPAAGILLVIPELPPQYRIVGFFAGAQARPAIAITNRAHRDYEALLKVILSHTDPAVHAPDLFEG